MKQVEKWGIFEENFVGRSDGNPYWDYDIKAIFTTPYGEKKIEGFYDGEDNYKIRFMPEAVGAYTYKVFGSFSDEVYEGEFQAVEASVENHGPVQVENKVCLKYADGSPYYSIGTTCYAWVNQPLELQEQTLETLKHSSFNKIRFCFFPKYYLYNLEEPISYPFMRGEKKGQDEEQENMRLNAPKMFKVSADGVADITDFDCYKINTEHFKRFDLRISQLKSLGIEADLILLHPYDKWGFSTMNWECDERYLKYVVARYAAFSNVWWSMANEYDLFYKPEGFWGDAGRLVASEDPYHHMISVHNCLKYYDFNEEWITHCSMQRIDLYRHVEGTDEYLKQYNKPVVWDEIAYEGNIDMGWGNISAQELVRRFWEAFMRGGNAGHGETYMDPNDVLWWAKGGVLHGESEPRFAFLLNILKETPGKYLKCGAGVFDEVVGIPYDQENKVYFDEKFADYEIHYYGFGRPSFRTFNFPTEESFKVELIDTWNMTIEDLGSFSGYCKVPMPGREYMALRIRREK